MKFLNIFVNPVIAKEYRLRMRTKKTPWIIMLYLLAISSIIFIYINLSTGSQAYFDPNRSKELFIILSFTQFILISFATPGLTAGVISGEREKQTLNILLTTNLSASKIIIGKWFSSLSFMLLLIIATLPLYSIVFIFGGISPLQLFKIFLFFIISMLAIGSAGVFFSTIVKRTGAATVLTYALIVGYTIITFLLPEIIRSYSYKLGSNNPINSSGVIEWLQAINPFYGLLDIFEESFNVGKLPISPYLIFIIFFSVVTVIFLLLAIYFIKPYRKRKLLKD